MVTSKKKREVVARNFQLKQTFKKAIKNNDYDQCNMDTHRRHFKYSNRYLLSQ